MKTLFGIIAALSAAAAIAYGIRAYTHRGSGFGKKAIICLAIFIAAALSFPSAYNDEKTANTAEVHITRAPISDTAAVTDPASSPDMSPSPEQQSTLPPGTDSAGNFEGQYVASSKSDKFHYPSCSSASRISEDNRLWFDTRDDAVAAGYSPCGRCKP